MKRYSIILYIILSVAIFFVVIDPKYQEVQELREIKQRNDELLDKAEELKRKRQELTDRYNSITSSEREKLSKLLPETIDNIRLQLNIDNISKNPEYQLELQSFSFSGDIDNKAEDINNRVIDSSGKKYGTINVSFNFTSSYPVFKKFMSDLEDSLRIVDIRDFSIASSGTSGQIYNFSVSLDTYWLR